MPAYDFDTIPPEAAALELKRIKAEYQNENEAVTEQDKAILEAEGCVQILKVQRDNSLREMGRLEREERSLMHIVGGMCRASVYEPGSYASRHLCRAKATKGNFCGRHAASRARRGLPVEPPAKAEAVNG